MDLKPAIYETEKRIRLNYTLDQQKIEATVHVLTINIFILFMTMSGAIKTTLLY
jgi:hypothetical protein